MRPAICFLTVLLFACSSKAATDGTSVDTTATSTDDVSSSDTFVSDTSGEDAATGDTVANDTTTSDAVNDTDAQSDTAATCSASPDGKCAICLQANCATEISACLGTTWQTADDPKAPCGGLYEGICKCEVDHAAADINSSCGPKDVIPTLPAACATSFDTLSKCIGGKCANDCN